MPSSSYLLRRLGNTLIVILGVATATFFISRLSGDPVDQLLPMEAPPEVREALRRQLGLDAPLLIQFVNFLANIVQGNFGNSLRYTESAIALYWQRFPATLELVTASVVVSVVMGITFGIMAAANRGKPVDSLIMWFALLGQAIPGFYLGLMLILLFSLQWKLLPTGGHGTWQQLIMPVIVLSSYYIALIARMTRASCLDVLSQDYIRTARSKGLSHKVILYKHVLKNALIPIVTIIGLQIGGLLSGAVVVETVFTWPGVGRLALDAIYSRDFPVIQTVVILSATIFVLVNLCVDILYMVIDPRIKYE